MTRIVKRRPYGLLELEPMSFVIGIKKTTDFHHKANSRRWRNYIKGLEDVDWQWRTSKDEIESIVVNYFEQLFKSTKPVDMDRAL